jgi:hypothetical protein
MIVGSTSQAKAFLKLMCFILYTLGLVSLVLILMMAQSLESNPTYNTKLYDVVSYFGTCTVALFVSTHHLTSIAFIFLKE